MNIKNEVKKRLEKVIDDLFVELHAHYETQSGDMTPHQEIHLDQLTSNLSELIATQIEQNLDNNDSDQIQLHTGEYRKKNRKVASEMNEISTLKRLAGIQQDL